jgi:holo-[acyl-carrier protein] synthase
MDARVTDPSASPKPNPPADRGANVEKQMEQMLSGVADRTARRALSGDDADKLRVGVDVVDIDVLGRQLAGRHGTAFKNRVFTTREIDDCRDQVAKFATRWALKEAVSKAIGTGFREGLTADSIEVLTAPDGAIRVAASPGATWPRNAHQWTWTVSAAHESEMAVAVAVAVP